MTIGKDMTEPVPSIGMPVDDFFAAMDFMRSKRSSVMDTGNGLLKEAVDEDGNVTFKGKFGSYEFSSSTADPLMAAIYISV